MTPTNKQANGRSGSPQAAGSGVKCDNSFEAVVGLVAAAETAARWMQWWLDQDVCECEGPEHACGRTERERELENLRREIRRYKSAINWATDKNWRSMDTAPTDGTHVLLWDGEFEVIGFYVGDSSWGHGWEVWCHCSDCKPIDPIAWMPLPEPPESER